MGLVGESGSGKSITCLSLMRLVPRPAARIVEGEVWFGDQNLLELTENEMREYRGRRMAMIMQDPQTSLNPGLYDWRPSCRAVKLHLKERGRQALDRVLETLYSVRIPSPETRLKQIPISSAVVCDSGWLRRWVFLPTRNYSLPMSRLLLWMSRFKPSSWVNPRVAEGAPDQRYLGNT